MRPTLIFIDAASCLGIYSSIQESQRTETANNRTVYYTKRSLDFLWDIYRVTQIRDNVKVLWRETNRDTFKSIIDEFEETQLVPVFSHCETGEPFSPPAISTETKRFMGYNTNVNVLNIYSDYSMVPAIEESNSIRSFMRSQGDMNHYTSFHFGKYHNITLSNTRKFWKALSGL